MGRVLLVVVALVVFRSVAFVAYEQLNFDADQAVIGLAAKHVSQLRALPVFQYALDYVLMVEAWLAAPFVALAGSSVASIKLPLLVMNAAAASLLVVFLTVYVGLQPIEALVASLFFVLPPPITTAELMQTLGGNIEPFLYVLLLWLTRQRPVAFGLIFGVGFLNREFTAYAIPALLVVEALEGRLFTRENLRAKAVSLVVVAAVITSVQALKLYGDTFGPGTADPRRVAAADNVDVLGAWFCRNPALIAPTVWQFAASVAPDIFGARSRPLRSANVNSEGRQGLRGLWPLLVATAVFIGVRLAQCRRRLVEGGWWPFPLYLVLIGGQAGAAFAIARCGSISIYNIRYALLVLLVPIGLVALHLRTEPRRVFKALVVAVVIAWAAVSAKDTAAMHVALRRTPPAADHRALADYLVSNGIRYARADYWTAYHVTFLADEQAIVTAEGFVRIQEYERLVNEHAGEAIWISRRECPGGTRVRGWFLCDPAR